MHDDEVRSPLLTMQGIAKSFPGVKALQGVDLTLHQGEVLALLGENGAGKSTLIKVLSGAHCPDSGSICVHGELVEIGNPVEAERHGIAVIYQEFNLIPALSAMDNIFLGHEQSKHGLIEKKSQEKVARALFARIGVAISPHTVVNKLTVAQQQAVEIAKALARDARILVMDEPSAALSHHEVESLYQVIDDLRSQGIGIIYISHRLDEIERLADRISVLRDGSHVGTCKAGEVSRDALIALMVGRTLESEFPERTSRPGPVRFEVDGVRRAGSTESVTFDIHQGEVVGLTGLVGAGRTELARVIFGADPKVAGELRLDGKTLAIESPREAIAAGVCLLTEDRKAQGLILGLSVRENFGLPNLQAFQRLGLLRRPEEAAAFQAYVDHFDIKIPSTEQAAGHLSGGNQQKVVLAKWLYHNADVIIFDEPTRGIDVGAKFEIYQLIDELAAEGKAILMISSELPEVIGMSDRIVVMREGQVAGILEDGGSASQQDILRLAMGETNAALAS